jgi:hypothetical protein
LIKQENEMKIAQNRGRHHDCKLSKRTDLDSDLGIAAWVNDAMVGPLEPWSLVPEDSVPRISYLRRGNHRQRPSGGGASALPDEKKVCEKKVRIYRAFTKCLQDHTPATPVPQAASADQTRKPNNFFSAPAELEPTKNGVRITMDECSDDQANNVSNQLIDAAGKAKGIPRACVGSYFNLLKLLYPDDPLDAITHNVQFFLAWSANATPTWSLMRFRGPGGGAAGSTGGTGSAATSSSSSASGSFASASRTDTHTLAITLGPSGVVDAEAVNNKLVNAINNLTQPKE